MALLMSAALTLLTASYLTLFPPRKLLDNFNSKVRFYYPTNEKIIFLTIDDGPSESTMNILNVLYKYDVKATFFVIGSHALKYPSVMETIASHGHQIGSHDFIDAATVKSTPEIIKYRLERTEGVLKRYTNNIKVFRPGCGFYNDDLLKVLDYFNYKCILGDTYAHDCQLPFPNFTAWHSKMRVNKGSIIILHDGDTRGLNTAQVLDDIIPYFLLKGYRFGLVH